MVLEEIRLSIMLHWESVLEYEELTKRQVKCTIAELLPIIIHSRW
jgi:hypothetical protein